VNPPPVPAIEATGLHVAREGRAIVADLDLSIPAGRWTALVGPNGAGKTTLLLALAGLLPSSGQVRWFGRDLERLAPRERGRCLAWMAPDEAAGADLCAHDVVMLGRLPHQGWLAAPSAADQAAVERAMRRTGCWDSRDRALAHLSAGERQRVLLARVFAVEAPLMLMDEPLAHLDPPHQADWLQLVRAHVANGGTVVTVLHELNLALEADDLVVLAGGAVRSQGETSDPALHRSVESVFGHRIIVQTLGDTRVASLVATRGTSD